MKPILCHQGDCSRALAQHSQINGLRQLRDATGGHQVGWKSPTVDDDEMESQQRSEEGQTGIEVQCRAELGIQGLLVWNWCAQEHEASENWQECHCESVTRSERRRPAIDRATALRTDWRRFSRLVGKSANVALPKSSFVSTRLTIRVWKTDDGTGTMKCDLFSEPLAHIHTDGQYSIPLSLLPKRREPRRGERKKHRNVILLEYSPENTPK